MTDKTEKEYRLLVAAACQMGKVTIDTPRTAKSMVCFNLRHRDGSDCYTTTVYPQTWEAAFQAIQLIEKCDWDDRLDMQTGSTRWSGLY